MPTMAVRAPAVALALLAAAAAALALPGGAKVAGFTVLAPQTLPTKSFPAAEHYPDVNGVLIGERDSFSSEARRLASGIAADRVADAHAAAAHEYASRRDAKVSATHTDFSSGKTCMNAGRSAWRADTPQIAATAAFLALQAYNLGQPGGPAVGKSLGWSGQDPKIRVVLTDLNGRQSEAFGMFVGPFFAALQGGNSGVLWIAVRGSDSSLDWKRDLTAEWREVRLSRSSGGPVDIGSMHRGFAEVWQQYRFSRTVAGLRRRFPNAELRFTGHSLGGALAQLLALETHLIAGGRQPSVFTFGSPRVGGYVLRRWLRDHVYHYRYVNTGDLVPSVPTYDLGCSLLFGIEKVSLRALDGLFAAADGHVCPHFHHSADVSIHLLPVRGSTPTTRSHAECWNEDNTRDGINVADHSIVKYYLPKVFDLAIAHTGGRFNGGHNPFFKA